NPAEAGYSSRTFVKTAHFSGVSKIILALGFQPNAILSSYFITLQLSRKIVKTIALTDYVYYSLM
ncbi:MAG: hypothetical protein RIC84_20210, partial [Aggregatilineales bacterium]